MDIYLKKDYMQYTGSFKERGARYTLMMLEPEQKSAGVIAASAGNHALALAYHGGQLNISVTVVMPIVAPIMKVENCKKYGANVIVHGKDIGESRERALEIGREKGLMYINGFDHPNILAGQGTMGLEIIEQVPDVDAVVIPVGGGGLIAGCAVALKTMNPKIKIIGVEPERCPSFANALKAGTPVFTPTTPSIADGLTVPTVGCNAVATALPLIDKMVQVSVPSLKAKRWSLHFVEATLTQLFLDVAWTVAWQLMADWSNSHVPLVTDQAVWPNSPIASSGLESPSKIFNRRGLGSKMTYFLFKTPSWWKPGILNMLKRWLPN